MPRENTVEAGEKKIKSNWISGRILRIPGLKPSDWYLVQQIREYFSFDLRQVLVLGIRLIYAGFHDPHIKRSILILATQVKAENLDVQEEKIEYKKLKDIQ